MARKPFYRPRKFTWILPLIILIFGVLKFTNIAFKLGDVSAWYVLIALAVVMFVIGVVQHKRFNEINP